MKELQEIIDNLEYKTTALNTAKHFAGNNKGIFIDLVTRLNRINVILMENLEIASHEKIIKETTKIMKAEINCFEIFETFETEEKIKILEISEHLNNFAMAILRTICI